MPLTVIELLLIIYAVFDRDCRQSGDIDRARACADGDEWIV